MPNLADVVDAIHPADEQEGVIVGDQIFVLFDREIDENTLEQGGLFVTGPDTDTWSGPDQAMWLRRDPNALTGPEGDVLQSPGFQGIVPGTFTFERIDLTVASSGVDTLDVTGAGTLYRTKAIFTPSTILAPDTEYTVHLIGDEDDTDSVMTGTRPRTIFDPEHSGTGSDDITMQGTYLGDKVSDVVNMRIVTSGVKRTATFDWWLSSAPLDVKGPVLTDKKVFLSDGVFVEFGDGVFRTSDEFTAVVKKQNPLEGSIFWTFKTGSGSVVDVPDDISTSVIGNIVPVTTAVATTTFGLSTATPLDRATNLPVTTNQIVLEFNSDVDPATVTSETVRLVGEPVNGDEDLLTSREIYKDITVSGNKIIMDF
jgi:hypothetical protein